MPEAGSQDRVPFDRVFTLRCLSFGPCELLTLSSPFVFGGFGASGTGRGTERPTRTGGLVGSWWGGGPCPAREGDPEGGQAGPVDRGGAGADIGGDPFLAPGPGFAATPGNAYVMGDLAFHLRPGAGVGVLPCRVGLGATSCVFAQERGSLNVVEKTTFDMPARASVPGSPSAAYPDMTR